MQTPDEVTEEIKKQTETIFGHGELGSYFKYCNDSAAIIHSIFEDHKIRFTQPRALNDPLEFNPTLLFNDPESKHQSYQLNNIIFPSVELFFRSQLIESQINKYGILSLTKDPDSFEMWSHYANGHRGFWIEFNQDFSQYPSMLSKTGEENPVREVNYVHDYSINVEAIVNEQNEILLEILHDELFFKKTSRWSHEHEYRMVRPLTDCDQYQPPETRYAYTDTNVYLFDFSFECVSSIGLGANMAPEKKSLIVRYCQEYDIPLFQSYIICDHPDRFGKPGTVLHVSLDDVKSKTQILNTKHQLLCTNKARIGYRNSVKQINHITELPYYAGYENVVNEFLQNVQNGDYPMSNSG